MRDMDVQSGAVTSAMRDGVDEAPDVCCGNCANFNALDDLPADPCKWFGVCMQEVERDLDCECDTNKAFIWVYDHGRRGQDYCKRPDEWFEEW